MLRRVLVGGFALALAGCVSPMVVPEEPSFQPKMRNVKHWADLAARVVDGIADDAVKPYGGPFYVMDELPDSAFSCAFRELVEQELIDRGYVVTTSPDNAVRLHVGYQPVVYPHHRHHAYGHYKSNAFFSAGAFATAAWFFWPALGVVVPGWDAVNGPGGVLRITNAELLLQAHVASPVGNVVASHTEALYIEDEDVSLYLGHQFPMRSLCRHHDATTPAVVSLPAVAPR